MRSKELFHAAVVGTKGQKVCLESTVVLVDMASSVSKVEWLGVMVEDMARLVELTEEELVEIDELTNWSASWIGTDSSCLPSYKVPAGLMPTRRVHRSTPSRKEW